MRWHRWLLPLVGLLAGCVRLGVRAPQIRDYRLDYTPPVVAGAPLPVIVAIGPLAVAAVYDREPIISREKTYATEAYFDSRWSANPGNMVADLLARDFVDSGLYRAVQRGPSLLPNDYQISGQIEEIEERVTDRACTAHLRLHILVVRMRPTKGEAVLSQQVYVGDEPSACNAPPALAAAMSQAMADVSARMQRDVHDAIAADSAAARLP
ncbi:MAG: ABC-type transport auxiliary lipoprotein family protein [Candidatus Binatia bacterium]